MDPQAILGILGSQVPDTNVVSYLRGGHVLNAYCGWSNCRFRCGVPDHEMGDSDLTDGTWLWRPGLVHYVEVHGVALPDEFLARTRAMRGEVPELSEAQSSELIKQRQYTVDVEYWITWLWTLEHPVR